MRKQSGEELSNHLLPDYYGVEHCSASKDVRMNTKKRLDIGDHSVSQSLVMITHGKNSSEKHLKHKSFNYGAARRCLVNKQKRTLQI